jgi:RimJ/RimL family protein N-acetyltransferase
LLQGKLVSLRGVEKEDYEPIREWLTDPDLLHLLGARPIPIGNVDAEKLPELFRLREGRVLAITTRDKVLVGLIAVGNFHEFNRTAQVIVLIGDRGEWGRGFGTDALRMVTRFAFDDLNLNSLEAHIPEFNGRALKAFAKVGYEREGQLRKRLFLRGRYWDVVVAGALRDTWNGGVGVDQATMEAAAQSANSESAAAPVGAYVGHSSEPRPVPIGQSDTAV